MHGAGEVTLADAGFADQQDGELGGGDAGEQLYDRHVGAVARFFQNKVPDQVEELMQQTFLALVESRDRIRAGVTFRAYLLAIARYKLLDHLARKTSGKARVVDLEADSMVDLAPGPSTVMARKREQRLLLEGLRRIPVEHQIALELFYWEGLNAAEIAEVFGISLAPAAVIEGFAVFSFVFALVLAGSLPSTGG